MTDRRETPERRARTRRQSTLGGRRSDDAKHLRREIAGRVHFYMTSRGFTQIELATKAEVGDATVRRVLDGENVSVGVLAAIAKALSVHVASLMFTPSEKARQRN